MDEEIEKAVWSEQVSSYELEMKVGVYFFFFQAEDGIRDISV